MCNILYVFIRLNIPSDPVVSLFDPVVTCKFCKCLGHSKLTCHLAKAEAVQDLSPEDVYFWCYVDPEDRPESLKEYELVSDNETDSESEDEVES